MKEYVCGEDDSGTRRMFEINESTWDAGEYYSPLY
jgi:hypothetical protein